MTDWILKYFLFTLLIVVSVSCEQVIHQQPGQLPLIHLYFNEGSIDYDKKSEAEVHIQHGNTAHSDLARLKYRGGISRAFPKRSFTFNLQSDPQLPFLDPDNDYILNSSFIDKTLMRHAYTYDLFKKMTDDNRCAPESEFVELHINHNYNGLYLLHPRVDRSYLKIKEDGCIFKDPPLFFSVDPPPIEQEINPYHQKYPDLDRRDDNIVLQAIRDTFRMVNLCDGSIWKSTLDRNNIINWHLLLLVAHSSDNLLKNFYLYRRNDESPFKICVWDFDHSFGRDGDNEYNPGTEILDLDRNWLLSGLMECPVYRSDLKSQYNSLRLTGPLNTEIMIGRLDSMYAELRDEIYRNGQRWSWKDKTYFDENSADEELELMKAFIRRKMKQLDEVFL